MHKTHRAFRPSAFPESPSHEEIDDSEAVKQGNIEHYRQLVEQGLGIFEKKPEDKKPQLA